MITPTHLDNCISIANNFFSAQWWEKYNFHKETTESQQSEIEQFLKDLNEFEIEIFKQLNFSVLKGEYAIENNLLKKLSDFIQIINGATEYVPTSEIVQAVIFTDEFPKTIQTPFTQAIDHYTEFVLNIYQKFNLSSKEYIFKYHAGINEVHEEKDWQTNNTNLLLFQLNIRVAEYDHSLIFNEDNIYSLFHISRLLTDCPGEERYSLLIKNKCEYLRNKLLLRTRYENKNKQTFTLVKGKEKQVTITAFKDTIFDEWIDYIDSHYELNDNWKYIIEDDFKSKANIELKDQSLRQLHRGIKYYKDVDKISSSSKQLNNITTIIQTKWNKAKEKKQTNPFDFHALAISLNYSVNNELSLACEDLKTDISKVKEIYNRVIDIQEETRINNFFPQHKFLYFLLAKLDEIDRNHKALESIKEYRIIVDECLKIIKSYEKNVLWSEKNYNYVFQLPYDECLIELKNDANIDKIFIYSSFLMPLPKDKYVAELKEYKAQILQRDASIKVLENINTDISHIKDRELKMMEMLGIFTALISFVAASLPTFRLFNTALEAALFILALGTSFASFVFLLLVTARGLDKIKKHADILLGSSNWRFILDSYTIICKRKR